MKISEEYGAYIKAKRVENGLTQAEVANKLGISQQAYSRYEKGTREPDFEHIVKIADVLGFPPGEFLNEAARR